MHLVKAFHIGKIVFEKFMGVFRWIGRVLGTVHRKGSGVYFFEENIERGVEARELSRHGCAPHEIALNSLRGPAFGWTNQ